MIYFLILLQIFLYFWILFLFFFFLKKDRFFASFLSGWKAWLTFVWLTKVANHNFFTFSLFIRHNTTNGSGVQYSSSISKWLTKTVTECLEYQSFKATNFVNLQLFHQLVLSWNANCCNVNLYIWLQPTFKLRNCALSLHLHVSLYVLY